jgi:hypothetical protein
LQQNLPTQEERLTATSEEIALVVAQLRARIDQRRQASWLPEPDDAARERRAHWQRVAEQHKRKVQAGEYITDAMLLQIREDKTTNVIGRQFLTAAERGNAPMVGAFIEEGFPVNYQDRLTLETALHISAAARARSVLRVLLACELCNFLLRDKGGRLASELAYLFGQDLAAARLLGIKERIQAEAQGIKLTRRASTSP